MSVMSSVFVKLMLKRSFLVRNTSHQFIIFQIKPRYYSRKRNQIGTYGPFKIVKADHLCDGKCIVSYKAARTLSIFLNQISITQKKHRLTSIACRSLLIVIEIATKTVNITINS